MRHASEQPKNKNKNNNKNKPKTSEMRHGIEQPQHVTHENTWKERVKHGQTSTLVNKMAYTHGKEHVFWLFVCGLTLVNKMAYTHGKEHRVH